MLSVHGLLRVVEVDTIKRISNSFSILNLRVQAYSRKRSADGSYEDRFDHYHASMFFSNKEIEDLWIPQIYPGRVLEVRWASLYGETKDVNGELKGWTKIRLYPDIRHTIPK